MTGGEKVGQPRRTGWRRRIGLTEGRLYSTAVVVVVVALLAPTLAHWKAVAAQKPLSGVAFSHRPPVANPAPSAPSTTTPPSVPVVGTELSPGLSGFSLGPPVSLPGTGLGDTSSPNPTPLPPLTAPTQTALPTPVTCQAAALNAATTKLLDQLNASLKVLPTGTLETALGLATGCNTANPALLAVGALT
jgi:hypothetical protein